MGICLAQSAEHVTLDLGVLCLSPMLGIQFIYMHKNNKNGGKYQEKQLEDLTVAERVCRLLSIFIIHLLEHVGFVNFVHSIILMKIQI